jgi:DNA helicase II / ATP-dependent DNA helicase PcrA
MKFVADLHLHSKYSRAVSQNMTLSNMAQWAKTKGINVVGTGDFTHPFWFDSLKEELEDCGNGLFRLNYKLRSDLSEASRSELNSVNSEASRSDLKNDLNEIYFMFSCEISSIYSQGGRGRRIHNLFIFPSLDSVEKFNKQLIKKGVNLRSDGRPIVGLSSRDLAEIALSCSEKCLIIPAHIWTPWFSLFGAFSGFDSIEECFSDMSEHIYAVETGLSSDPAMNWTVGNLDNRALVSFSDAHSLEKMGREVTVFEGDEISYDSIYEAIRYLGNQVTGTSGELASGYPVTRPPEDRRSKIAFTIEFYPEEGKYHFTGHRDCAVSYSPEDVKTNGSKCPECRKDLTIGVMNRVKDLQSREFHLEIKEKNGLKWKESNFKRPPFVSLVPLNEILAEVFNVGVGTVKVKNGYLALVNSFGSEFNVLLKADLLKIAKVSGERVSEAIGRVRNGSIVVEPGYDGKFGVVKILDGLQFDDGKSKSQLDLFA